MLGTNRWSFIEAYLIDCQNHDNTLYVYQSFCCLIFLSHSSEKGKKGENQNIILAFLVHLVVYYSLMMSMHIQDSGWISISDTLSKKKKFYYCASCTFLPAACIFHNNHRSLKMISVLFRHCYWLIRPGT